MEKIKQFVESDKGKDILVVIIIILVGLGSFELGRLSKNTPGGLKIEYTGQKANTLDSIDQTSINTYDSSYNLSESKKINSENYFASSKGSKYYSLGCSGGKTIKQENRIYFKTNTDAEKAGYVLSSSCK